MEHKVMLGLLSKKDIDACVGVESLIDDVAEKHTKWKYKSVNEISEYQIDWYFDKSGQLPDAKLDLLKD